MYLKRISIINYKNIREAELSFSPKINCFIGNNGEGKTNLLDSVYYLSFCKSHSNTTDTQNITHDEPFFVINGFYDLGDVENEIYCGLKRKQKKQFKRNKKEYERLADHIGLIPLVIVSPNDSELILGGSEERRKFIDGFISQYDKRYLNSLLAYNKALQQRNALVKAEMADETLLDIWEEQMAQHGEYIFEKRSEFIDQFVPFFNEFHAFISQEKEIVSLEYHSQLKERPNLKEMLKEVRQRDMILGHTSRGIHKDDLDMKMGELAIKKIGSQGQNKTFLIALKLAQFDFLKRIVKAKPILLFDDIFDKLDAGRVQQIILLLKNNRFGQVFISDTNREHVSEILKSTGCEYHLYTVEGGNITLSEKMESL